jgi:hypothetical protein
VPLAHFFFNDDLSRSFVSSDMVFPVLLIETAFPMHKREQYFAVFSLAGGIENSTLQITQCIFI